MLVRLQEFISKQVPFLVRILHTYNAARSKWAANSKPSWSKSPGGRGEISDIITQVLVLNWYSRPHECSSPESVFIAKNLCGRDVKQHFYLKQDNLSSMCSKSYSGVTSVFLEKILVWIRRYKGDLLPYAWRRTAACFSNTPKGSNIETEHTHKTGYTINSWMFPSNVLHVHSTTKKTLSWYASHLASDGTG